MDPSRRAIVRLNPAPTPDILETIGPGCYVRVALAKGCAWVEVTEEQGDLLEGRIHHQLGGPDCPAGQLAGQTLLCFRREQIIDLGCHHYCFC